MYIIDVNGCIFSFEDIELGMFLIIFLEFMYVCINVYFNLNCGFFYVDVEDLFVFVIYLEVYIVFG